MRLVGIDLGTQCGYAWTDTAEVDGDQCGCWDLSVQRHEGGGMRFFRFRENFAQLLDTDEPVVVLYEKVARHGGTHAAHIYGGLLGHLQEMCEERSIPYRGFDVGKIKKRATDAGNASKRAMIDAAHDYFGYEGDDDNAADALWILRMGLDSVSSFRALEKPLEEFDFDFSVPPEKLEGLGN